MHYGLKQACPKAEVACAFDINVAANDVYEHNHGRRPHQVRSTIVTKILLQRPNIANSFMDANEYAALLLTMLPVLACPAARVT